MIETSKADSVNEIRNMLYKYCWLVDRGQYDEIAEMFKDATIAYEGVPGYTKDPVAHANSFKDANQTYEDGTPHTFHMCINPMIEVDLENGTATADHYTVVLQGKTGEFGPMIIVMDYKYDKLVFENGHWKFVYRNQCNRAVGDLSHHLNPHIAWG